nr:inovirus-type Gp2 protein [Variovorax sp. Root411]
MNKNPHRVSSPNLSQSDHAYHQLAAQAMRQRCLLWQGTVLHRARSHDRPISLIHEVADELLVNSAPLFEVKEARRGLFKLGFSESGKRLVEAASADFVLIEQDMVLHEKSPVLMLFFRMRSFLPMNLRMYLDDLYARSQVEAMVEFLNRMVGVLRRRLARKVFKERQKNFERNAIENFIGLSECIDRLARRHTEVIALRFDLFYRRPGSEPAQFDDVPDVSVLEEFVDQDARFHRSMIHRFGKDLLGYAWALEFGREAGFHKHYLVFLRPQGNEDHAGLVDLLEVKWLALTEGRGFLHNCNRNAHSYKPCAIGLVRLDDPQVLEGLRFIVVYFTLAGLYMRLAVPQSVVKFGKGGDFTKERGPKKAGRKPHIKRGKWARHAVALAQAHYLNFM